MSEPVRSADSSRNVRNSPAVVATAVVILGLLVWSLGDVLLVIFAGILLGVFLHALSEGLARLTGIPEGWALATVLLALAALLGLIAWLLGADIVSQLDELIPRLQKVWAELRGQLRHSEWGRALLAKTGAKAVAQADAEWLVRLSGGFFAGVAEALASVLVVIVVGLYTAAKPATYVGGFLRLIPAGRRKRAAEVLAALGKTLRWWLIGTVIRMVMLGVATSLGLILLGMPLALALGLIAFLFDFVPYLGAILAAVPALLVALTVGPAETAYVALLYLGIHAVEAYLVAPLIDQRSVRLPPALAISAQILLGASFLGLFGIMFAAPLMAVVMLLVKMLYLEDRLGERPAA